MLCTVDLLVTAFHQGILSRGIYAGRHDGLVHVAVDMLDPVVECLGSRKRLAGDSDDGFHYPVQATYLQTIDFIYSLWIFWTH